jgi:transcriptional regulator with XRE-family HTH domain
MLSHEELLEHPNYLLTTYQLEIYRQLDKYMKSNNLKGKDVAKKLNVSRSYVSQILSGEFNFTLKKLVELGLMMNKVPYLEFIDPSEYWRREKEGTKQTTYITVSSPKVMFSDYDFDSGGSIPEYHVTIHHN